MPEASAVFKRLLDWIERAESGRRKRHTPQSIEEAGAKRVGYLTRETGGGRQFSPQDLASQRGAPKPDFETELGEPIFPEDEEEAWWQTQLSRRAPKDEEPVVGDEDVRDEGISIAS